MSLYYRAASYGPRYGDPVGTYVRLLTEQVVTDGAARTAAERAAEEERRQIEAYCDHEDCRERGCSCADVVTWGEHTFTADELFTAGELKTHRRALVRGEVVFLDR